VEFFGTHIVEGIDFQYKTMIEILVPSFYHGGGSLVVLWGWGAGYFPFPVGMIYLFEGT